MIAQRSGQLEPLMFDVSLLGFVVGSWADSLATAAGLGLLAALSPIAASLLQDPSEIAVGIWIMGIAFPWALGRLAARQSELAASSTPPAVSSPSRRCSRNGAGSPATSTTSSDTGLPPSCCRSPAPGTCCAATPRPPRRRCGRRRTWAGAT